MRNEACSLPAGACSLPESYGESLKDCRQEHDAVLCVLGRALWLGRDWRQKDQSFAVIQLSTIAVAVYALGTDLTQTQRLMVIHWRSGPGEGGVESDLWPPACCQSLGRRMNCLPGEDELPKGRQRECPVGSGMRGCEA